MAKLLVRKQGSYLRFFEMKTLDADTIFEWLKTSNFTYKLVAIANGGSWFEMHFPDAGEKALFMLAWGLE